MDLLKSSDAHLGRQNKRLVDLLVAVGGLLGGFVAGVGRLMGVW